MSFGVFTPTELAVQIFHEHVGHDFTILADQDGSVLSITYGRAGVKESYDFDLDLNDPGAIDRLRAAVGALPPVEPEGDEDVDA